MWRRFFSSQTARNVSVYVPKNVAGDKSSLLVTCEHAGNELPGGVQWGAKDLARGLHEKHWAFDPGALIFAKELADELEAPLVFSRFSRLFVDLNRPVSSRTLARKLCDGESVELNEKLTLQEKWKRINEFYLPYHEEVETTAQEFGASVALSVHTYTKDYEGDLRDFEVGVLHSSTNADLAESIADALNLKGTSARVNEPWSGKDGFMYSADCFKYNAEKPGTRDALMLELRNDVCSFDLEWRKKTISIVVDVLQKKFSRKMNIAL